MTRQNSTTYTKIMAVLYNDSHFCIQVFFVCEKSNVYDCWLDSLREVRIHTKTERGKGYVTDTWQKA